MVPTAQFVTATGFDALGRVVSRTLDSDGSGTVTPMTVAYGYDTASGAVSVLRAGWGTAPLSWFQNDSFTRDPVGNLLTATDQVTSTTECYRYDQWNRLTRARTIATGNDCTSAPTAGTDPYDLSWVFDDIDRILSRTDNTTNTTATYTYTDPTHPHAVTTISTGGTYTYNQTGAMVTRNGTTLGYDPLQRLISHDTTTTYIQSTTNQRLATITPTTRTLTLDDIEITATTTTRTITRYHTIDNTIIAITTTSNGTTTTTWNCADLHHSITCQTPATNTTSTPAITHYLPYGQPRTTTTPTGTRGYLAQPTDPTGLTYLNNRYYDPQLGVFTSVDPLVSKTGTPYLYTAGNPTTLSDPSGLSPWGPGSWLLEVLFGAAVHAVIQAEYMATYGDTYAEVGYETWDVTLGESLRGRIDLAALDPRMDPIRRDVGINEIRPTKASAERVLELRLYALSYVNASTLRVPGFAAMPGAWGGVLDNRPFDSQFDVAGVSVHAFRNGAGVINYTYDKVGGDFDWRHLVPELLRLNESMRSARNLNADTGGADIGLEPTREHSNLFGWVVPLWKATWYLLTDGPTKCVAPCTR